MKRRIKAVLSVMREGVARDPNFPEIQGATHYQRTAFESKAGFQKNVDRGQEVHRAGIYTAEGALRDPMDVLQHTPEKRAGMLNARHDELKFPVDAVEEVVGLNYYDPQSKELVPKRPLAKKSLERMARIYSRYLKNSEHRGKFGFLVEEGI